MLLRLITILCTLVPYIVGSIISDMPMIPVQGPDLMTAIRMHVCPIYPSVCEDNAFIEKLDPEIKQKKSQLDQEIAIRNSELLALYSANMNNGYIEYYINVTLGMVQTLHDLETKQIKLRTPQLPSSFKEAERTLKLSLHDARANRNNVKQSLLNFKFNISNLYALFSLGSKSRKDLNMEAPIVLMTQEYDQFAEKMTNLRNIFDKIPADLNNGIIEVAESRRNISKKYARVVNTFQELSKSFGGFIDAVTQKAEFADGIGLPKNLFTTININNLTKETSLKKAQHEVKSFLIKIICNMRKLEDQMRARDMLKKGK